MIATALKTGIKGALIAMLKALSRQHLFWIFKQSAMRLGVEAVEVPGQNGVLLAYVKDVGVLRSYLLDGRFFANAIDFIDGVFAGRPAGTYVDIGANIGAVVVPVAAHCPHVACYAFEPEPCNFRALTYNLARNGVAARVTTYGVALAHGPGTVEFELDAENFGDHRMRNASGGATPALLGEGARTTIHVRTDSLDSLLAGVTVTHPVVVKLDVQGAEGLVFSGGASTLAAADVLLLELWPYGMRRLGSDPADFVASLFRHFPFAAELKDDVAVRPEDFVPTPTIVEGLQAFIARRDATNHVNLILSKHSGGAVPR
ncbi:MAG: FkbM family methyltransferase [Gemmatimonas sp.]